MFDSVRARLTLWYTGVLALVLIVFAFTSYLFLSRKLTRLTDHCLAEMGRAFADTTHEEQQKSLVGKASTVGYDYDHPTTSNDDGAVIEAASEYKFKDYQFLVYDRARQVIAASPGLAVEGREAKAPVWMLAPTSPGLTKLLDAHAGNGDVSPVYATLSNGDGEMRALARVIRTNNRSYILVVIRPLDDREDLLEGAGGVLLVGVPLALALASVGGYFLARKSLAPVVAMSKTAARIGASNLHERLPVVNERDELGRLAMVFNGLLARLNESFEQQRRFMADASHELRTPVAIVRGEAEISLSRDQRSPEDYRESLAIVYDEGRRLTRIVEDLFTLVRSDAGQRQLKITDFYLDETIAECVRSMRTIVAVRGLSLEYDISNEMPFRGDEELVRRMILNLLDNAIKYSQAGGRVSVTGEARGGEYLLTFSDTGTGISVEAQPFIFERFYRVDKARSREENSGGTASGSGAGLGLAIARLVAEAHGGQLTLLRSDGRGSVFMARFPAPEPSHE